MAPKQGHDTPPPPHWPESVTYLTKARLSPTLPKELTPLISPLSKQFNPKPIKHPNNIQIKRIDQADHPANGQFGLFAKSKIKPNELIIPYLGVIHATITPESPSEGVTQEKGDEDEHESSDYDLSLLRLSSSEIINPFKGFHISIGIDACKFGNSARFVNDYRGINDKIGKGPNAEFRLGKGDNGEIRMEIWSLNQKSQKGSINTNAGGIQKGEEILVSYGKGWWGARKG